MWPHLTVRCNFCRKPACWAAAAGSELSRITESTQPLAVGSTNHSQGKTHTRLPPCSEGLPVLAVWRSLTCVQVPLTDLTTSKLGAALIDASHLIPRTLHNADVKRGNEHSFPWIDARSPSCTAALLFQVETAATRWNISALYTRRSTRLWF